jgi:hypothetical protein
MQRVNDIHFVGFEVMKSTILWDITQYSQLSVNRRFGGTYRLHLQGRKNKLSKLVACFHAGFLLGLFFRP